MNSRHSEVIQIGPPCATVRVEQASILLEAQKVETAGVPEEASAVTGINTGHRGQFPAYLQESWLLPCL